MNFNDHVQKGVAFYQEGKLSEAVEAFKEALKLQPDNAEIREIIRMAEEQARMSAKANISLVNEAKQRAKIMGITDVKSAIVEYSDALKKNPNDASARRSLASVYYICGLTYHAAGNRVKAIESYDKAIKLQPDYPLAFNKRGHANIGAGNYNQSISDFEKVLQFKPDDTQAKQNLANAYRERAINYDKNGDYARAIPDFEKLLELEPKNASARELLEMAKAELAKIK